MLEIMNDSNNEVLRPLMRFLCNASYCNKSIIEKFYNHKLVSLFYTLLYSGEPRIRCDAVWAVSNFIITSENIAYDFFVPEIVTRLIDLSYDEDYTTIRTEALGVLLNFMHFSTADIIEKLVTGYKLINLCMEFLKDEKEMVVDKALDILGTLLDYADGLGKKKNEVAEYVVEKYDIEVFVDLQAKNSDAIYKKVASLLQEYFIEHFE